MRPAKGAFDEHLPDGGRGHQGGDAGAGVQAGSVHPGHTTHPNAVTRPGADPAVPGQQPEGISGAPGLERPPRSAETARNTDPGGPPRPTGDCPPETERETRASTVGSSGRRSRRRPRNAERVRVVITGPVRRRRSRRTPLPGHDLTGDVQWFLEQLQGRYPERFRRRKAAKRRVLTLVQRLLPPHHKPGGRPPESYITRAADMVQAQQAEIAAGKGKQVVWVDVATACISKFGTMGEYRRSIVLRRLQNSVRARLKRQKEKNSPPGSSA